MLSQRPRLLRSILLGGVALAAATAVQAQETRRDGAAPSNEPTTVDDILVVGRTEGYQVGNANTATKLPLSLRETPQSITVFNRQRIEDFNLITIAEVLEQTPGVTVQQYDSNRILFNSRGFAIQNFQFDGVPTNYTTGAGGNSVLSDTSIYERIEVVRGATGLTTGSGEPGATVNMVRKRPTEDFRASTSLSAGSWDYYRGELDVSGPVLASGRIRARVVGAYNDRKNYVDFEHNLSPSLYGVIEADITHSTRLRVGADYLRTDSRGGSWSAAPLFFSDGTPAHLPRSYSAAAEWNRWERDSVNAFAVLEHDFGGEWVGRFAYNNRATDTESLLLAGSNSSRFADKNTGLGLNIVDTYSVSETREDSFDAYASGPFTLFGRRHELVIGANSFDRDLRTINAGITSRSYSTSTTVPAFPSIFTWNGEIGRPTVQNLGIPRNTVNVQEQGVYGALRLNPVDPLKIIIGGRYTDWTTKTDNFDNAGAFTNTTASYGEKRFTPYFGVVLELTSAISAFASYSDVFTPTSRRDKNNEQLEPTVGGNYEAGLKAELFAKRLYVSLNGFHMKQDNASELDPTVLPNSLPDGSSAYRAIGGVTTWGGEFEVAGSITPNWNMTGGYTYARSENPAGQRVFTVNPLHSIKWNTTYRTGPFTVGGGVKWQSSQYQDQTIPTGRFTAAGAPITAPGRVTQDGYILVDLLARYAVNERISLGVNVTNLFDKEYYRSVGYFNAGFWGQPRRVLFNLRARY